MILFIMETFLAPMSIVSNVHSEEIIHIMTSTNEISDY